MLPKIRQILTTAFLQNNADCYELELKTNYVDPNKKGRGASHLKEQKFCGVAKTF